MELTGETVLPGGLTLKGLFSRGGYRPTMALKRLEPEQFFANREGVEILQQRRDLLDTRPQDFLCEPDNDLEAEALVHFAAAWVNVHHVRTFGGLGRIWEPDFVLLGRLKSIEVVGGCVCFPTGWSLPTKEHQPVSIVHEPVPGLNLELGSQVQRFLADLKLGECYQRSNWGLTSSSQMHQHPRDRIPEIASDCDPIRTFLRVEWQALMPVDPLRVIFGIRIYHVTLAAVRQQPEAALLLSENLRTMPEPTLRYKRLVRCRDRVVEVLEER